MPNATEPIEIRLPDAYRIHVWQPDEDCPVPASAQEAVALLRAQRDAPRGTRESIRRFIQRLALELPHLFPGLPPPRGLGWHPEPPQLSGNTNNGVYTVAIDWATADHDAYPALSEAISQRLWVADEARGCFHVNGSVLMLPAPLQRRDPRTLPSREELLDTACASLRSVFDRLGMREVPADTAGVAIQRAFRVSFLDGWHALNIVVSEQGANQKLRISLGCSFTSLNAMLAKARGQSPSRDQLTGPTDHVEQRYWLPPTGAVPRHPDDRSFLITRPSQVPLALREMLQGVQRTLVPIVERMRTPEGIDALLNTDPKEQSPFYASHEFGAHKILAAHMACNPRTLALCEEYLAHGLLARAKHHVFPQALRALGNAIDYVLVQRRLPAKAAAQLSIEGMDPDVVMAQTLVR